MDQLLSFGDGYISEEDEIELNPDFPSTATIKPSECVVVDL